MATKNAECHKCECPTRRRCKDCTVPVCSDCHTHGQCENCVSARTYAFVDEAPDPRFVNHDFQYHGHRVVA